jgi:hypothetical protein
MSEQGQEVSNDNEEDLRRLWQEEAYPRWQDLRDWTLHMQGLRLVIPRSLLLTGRKRELSALQQAFEVDPQLGGNPLANGPDRTQGRSRSGSDRWLASEPPQVTA